MKICYPAEKIKGFTIIELIVVIAIISILASIVFANVNNFRMKVRDARRKADMHSLEVAILAYYASTGEWPNNDYAVVNWSDAYKAQLAPYLSTLPLDPLPSRGLGYGSYKMTWSSDPNCNGQYVLWMYMEGDNPGAIYCGWGTNHYFRLLGPY